MSQSEIADANRLIRPILASLLSLQRAVYAPTDPKAATGQLEQALTTFDRLVQAAQSAQDKQLEVQS
jgi:hypothetical protein